jgi:hypothetical protein
MATRYIDRGESPFASALANELVQFARSHQVRSSAKPRGTDGKMVKGAGIHPE